MTLALTQQAMDDYATFEALGNMPPNAGGYDDQPAEWVDAIRCVTAAKNKAEADHQNKQLQEQKAKSPSTPKRRK